MSVQSTVSMEELFEYMKTLRAQIYDVEDQAAKISFEEHTQCTRIQTLQKELDLVKDETRQLKGETAKMSDAKEQLRLQILEKQRNIASFETDYSTLRQTLEFMQQEKQCLSAKLVDQSVCYKKIEEAMVGKLKEHQRLLKNQNCSSQTRELSVNVKSGEEKALKDDLDHRMMMDIQAAQIKFDKMKQLNSEIVLENTELRQSMELVKTKMTKFKPELCEMDEESLGIELQAHLSDKAGEFEYMQSLQVQLMRLKEISHTANCSCGKEYIVKLDM